MSNGVFWRTLSAGLMALGFSAVTMALPQCEAVFPSVLQSHDAGRLTLQSDVRIYGEADNLLEFDNKNASGSSHCDKSECKITGTSSEKVVFPQFTNPDDFPNQATFPPVNTKGNENCNTANQSKTLTKSEYKKVQVKGQCTISIDSDVVIDELIITKGGEVVVTKSAHITINTLSIAPDSNDGLQVLADSSFDINELAVSKQGKFYSPNGSDIDVTGYGAWLIEDDGLVTVTLNANPLASLDLLDKAQFVVDSVLAASEVSLEDDAFVTITGEGELHAQELTLIEQSSLRSSASNSVVWVTVYRTLSLHNANNSEWVLRPHALDEINFGGNFQQLQLSEGTYFINKVSSLDGSDSMELITYGDVRWWIYSDLTVDEGRSLSLGGANATWQVFVDGNVAFANDSEFKGILYSTGDLNFADDAKLTGVFAGSNVSLLNNTSVTKADLDIEALLPDLCTPPIRPYFRAFRVTLDGNEQATVSLDDYPNDVEPLVFVSSPYHGGVAADVAVTAVSTTEFSIGVWQPDDGFGDNLLSEHSVDVYVASPGTQTLKDTDGNDVVTIEAGRIETCQVEGNNVTAPSPCTKGAGEAVSFSSFSSSPAVIAQAQGQANGSDFLTAKAVNVSRNGAQVGLEASKQTMVISEQETIAWLAMEGNGEVLIDGESRRVKAETNMINHDESDPFVGWASWPLSPDEQCEDRFKQSWQSPPFAEAPMVIANKRSRNWSDGGWARICEVDDEGVNLVIDSDSTPYWYGSSFGRAHVQDLISVIAIGAAAEKAEAFNIDHNGQGITCQGTPVTITNIACGSDCANETSTVTLVPSTGWIGEGINYQNGITTLTFAGAETTVELWSQQTVGSVPVAISSADYTCSAPTADCSITYQSSALLLEAQAGLGCKTQELTVKAVKANETDPSVCVPQFTGAQPIKFNASPNLPSSVVGTPPPTLTLNGATLPLTSSDVSHNIDFDINGIATVGYQYSDVGRLTLNASYDQDKNGEQVEINGTTNLDLLPAGFHIGPLLNALKACNAQDSSCDVAAKAGEEFDLTVTAACYQTDGDSDFSNNPVATNFIHSGIELDTELVSPSGGHNNATEVTAIFASSDEGVHTVKASSDEVGVFRWQFKDNVQYLGETLDKNNVSSDAIGRFTPAYLTAAGNAPEFAPFCNGMNYYGQEATFESGRAPMVTLSGHATNGAETQNYVGNYWRHHDGSTEVSAVDVAVPAGVGVVASSPQSNLRDSSTQTLMLPNAGVFYQRTDNPVAPYNANATYVIAADALKDADGICYKTAHSESNADCLEYRFDDVNGTQWRDGRIAMRSVYGSETQDLWLPIEAQFFNASGRYQLNSEDSCTIPEAIDLSNGSSIGQATTALNRGKGKVLVPASGSVEVIEAEMRLDGTLESMQWWWQRDNSEDAVGRRCFVGSDPHLCNPKAQLSFGRYRGNDRVIYRREKR